MTVLLQNNFTLRGILSVILGGCLALATFYLISISPAIILSIGWICLATAILTLATSIFSYLFIQQSDDYRRVYWLDGLRYLTWFVGNSLLWIALCVLLSALLLRFFGASFWILAICAGGFAVSIYSLQGIFFLRKVIWYRLCWTIPDVVEQVADNPDSAILLSRRYALAIENNSEEDDYLGLIRLALRTPSAKIVEFDKLARKQIHLAYLPTESWMRIRVLFPVFVMTTLLSLIVFGVGWGVLQSTADPVRHILEPLIVAQQANEITDIPTTTTPSPPATATAENSPLSTPPTNQSEGDTQSDSSLQQENGSEGQSESGGEGDGQSESESNGEGQSESQSGSEGSGEGRSESQSESESGGEGEGDSQSQSESGGEGEGDSQSQSESGGEGQGDSQSQSESGGEGEGQSESESGGEGEGQSQSESGGEGQGDSQSESESSGEGQGEGQSESESSGEGEGQSESESSGEGQGEGQSESESGGEGEGQSESEGSGEGQGEGQSQADSNGQSGNGNGSGDSESGDTITFGLGESTPIVSDIVRAIPTPLASGINPADRITVDVPPMRDPSRKPGDPRDIDESEEGTLETAETAQNIDATQEPVPVTTDEQQTYQRIPNWILELTTKE